MPYVTNEDLPKPVRDHLPHEAQSTWRKIFNAAWEQYNGDEAKAFATAWAGLRRAGWNKKGDKWVKM
ncbi:MAG TPA: ChaB family protein [Desulfitobacteriaceae bacterium]|nr:ChaB family protein [Desulfitobacteriaceae bacterium]